MAGVDFDKAEEVRAMAEEIIDKHHHRLVDSKDLIGYYYRYGTSGWAGRAKKCTAFERHVTGKMLFVFINHDVWKALHYEQRIALVDHELCHFSRKSEEWPNEETGKFESRLADPNDPDSWQIRDHDVEEFSEIITRHGLWDTGIEQFAAAIRSASYQMTFDDVMNENHRPSIVPFARSAARESGV